SFPERHHGKLFSVAPLQSQVVESDIVSHGSSFQTKDIANAITTTDPWFRPVAIKDGPDGALYVADFYEPQIAHLRHFEGQIHTDSSQIYHPAQNPKAEIRNPKQIQIPKTRNKDLSKLSSAELVKLLESPNRWTRQTALRLMADHKDRSIIPVLTNLIKENTG